jgi:hypothetical protein
LHSRSVFKASVCGSDGALCRKSHRFALETGANAPQPAGTGGIGKPAQIQKLYGTIDGCVEWRLLSHMVVVVLVVRVADDATALQRESIVNALRNFIRDDLTQVRCSTQ